MMYQAYFNGKKVGKPRTEKEKQRVEPYYTGLLWAVVEDETEAEEVRG